MSPSISFLHTSPVHVQSFSTLLERLQPGVTAAHAVDERLLDEARTLGADHPDVVARVQATIRSLAQSGATVVVCTCSTIGGVAEATATDGTFKVLRIDRAMADEAVRLGPAVVVIAALESTLGPTVALIEDSARRMGQRVAIGTVLAADAWPCFERHDIDAYLAAVRTAVRQAVRGPDGPGPDVIVLAQASMAAAVSGLEDLGVPVLSSPELGLRAALGCVRS